MPFLLALKARFLGGIVMSTTIPKVTFLRHNGCLQVIFSGDWHLGTEPEGFPHKNGEEDPFDPLLSTAKAGVELLVENLGQWDSSLLVLVTQLCRKAKDQHIPIKNELPEGIRNLVKLALTVPPSEGKRASVSKSFLTVIGEQVLTFPKTGKLILEFLGETMLSLSRLIRGKAACNTENFWLCLQEASTSALPIVSLISLLVGFILAFVGVVQLRMFGAEIYVSSLVAIGMTRIMGAIMTGIILAGRTGASYAAVIGTMQVNEEIDALATLGISPTDWLLLPRLLALTAMTPLLVIYADVMGMIGGFLVGVGVLGLDPMEYYTFTQKGFGLSNLWVGVIHGAVFGLVIAITGCYQGLRCGKNAEAVGKATTQAVVFSIVGIVLSTAVLTLLCNLLEI